MFTLEFYETPNRITPLEEFLNNLKMIRRLSLEISKGVE